MTLKRFGNWLQKRLNEENEAPIATPGTAPLGNQGQSSNQTAMQPDQEEQEITHLSTAVQQHLNKIKTLISNARNKTKAKEVLEQIAALVMSIPGISETNAIRILKQAGGPHMPEKGVSNTSPSGAGAAGVGSIG